MVNRLNTLTTDEIQAFQQREKIRLVKSERPCAWCKKVVLMKPTQSFCAARCRALYYRATSEIQYEKMVQREAAWLEEREELVKEVADLRRQLGLS